MHIVVEDLGNVVTRKGESLQNIIKGSLSYLETCTEFRNNEKPIHEQKGSRPKETRPKSSSSSERLQFFLKQLDEIESGKALRHTTVIKYRFIIHFRDRRTCYFDSYISWSHTRANLILARTHIVRNRTKSGLNQVGLKAGTKLRVNKNKTTSEIDH